MTHQDEPPCPSWCSSGHHQDMPFHTAETGEVAIGDITISVEAVAFSDDRPPAVSLCRTEPGNVELTHLEVEAARAVRDAIDEALRLIGGER